MWSEVSSCVTSPLILQVMCNGLVRSTPVVIQGPMLPVESQALPWVTLKPGDIIATGTPTKLDQKADERKWLKAGDTFEMQVPEIGTLKNTVQNEKTLAI